MDKTLKRIQLFLLKKKYSRMASAHKRHSKVNYDRANKIIDIGEQCHQLKAEIENE